MNVSPADLQACFSPKRSSVTLVGATATLLIGANPNRISLTFGSAVGISFSVWPGSDVSSSKGFFIPQGFQPITFLFREVGALVNLEWWGFATGGGIVTIVEQQYFPQTCVNDFTEVF